MKLVNALGRLSTVGLYVSMAATIAIMLLVTVDVILRNLFAHSITGSVEISEFLQGVMVFLGIAATFRAGGHISVDMLVEHLHLRTQATIAIVTNLISLLVFGLMTYALYEIATGPGASREVSALLSIPTQPFRLIAVLGVGLMSLEIVAALARSVAALSGPQGSDATEEPGA